MGIAFFMVMRGMDPSGSLLLKVMAGLSAFSAPLLCLMQGKETDV